MACAVVGQQGRIGGIGSVAVIEVAVIVEDPADRLIVIDYGQIRPGQIQVEELVRLDVQIAVNGDRDGCRDLRLA